jgi:hypothetical protein
MLTKLLLLVVLVQSINCGNGGERSNNLELPPSRDLILHSYEYKPRNFSMYVKQMAPQDFLVAFNYTNNDIYDRYIFRVRYHGHEEYATIKSTINRTAENALLMRGFIHASYVVCVALYSSLSDPKEYEPLSTSGMCLDLIIGERPPIGINYSKTGLLAPLLMAVVAVFLCYICIMYYAERRKLMNNMVRRVTVLKKRRLGMFNEAFLFYILTRVVSVIKVNARKSKNKTLDSKSMPCIVNPLACTNSIVDDKLSSGYDNFAFNNDQQIINENNDDNNNNNNQRVLTSVESLSHLLEDKPWQSRNIIAKSNNSSHVNKQPIVFY